MKKKFEVPSLKVVEVNPTDVIATSDIYVGGEGEFDARRRGSFDWEDFDE